ncbi:hypothetical protein U1Q18_008868 [Sarracenia purpurea var. burkii]
MTQEELTLDDCKDTETFETHRVFVTQEQDDDNPHCKHIEENKQSHRTQDLLDLINFRHIGPRPADSVRDSYNNFEINSKNPTTVPLNESQEPTSLRGISRLLAQSSRATMTCNVYPRLCRAKGSPGSDCCKKRCVDVMTDRLNCGMCGNKCEYAKICCKGECVNPWRNKKNCGRCNNKCKKGSLCVYGMCSYA